MDESTHEIKILDPYYESCGAWNLCAYGRFTNLKRYNPNLKTLLSVGGWNEGTGIKQKSFVFHVLAVYTHKFFQVLQST